MKYSKFKKALSIVLVVMVVFTGAFTISSQATYAASKNNILVTLYNKIVNQNKNKKNNKNEKPVETPTEAPTEAEVITEAPTEAEIITEAPTEAEIITEAPTEAEIITEAPTEAEIITEAPTEEEITIEVPTEAATEPETEVVTEFETEVIIETPTVAEPSIEVSKYANMNAYEFAKEMGIGWNLGNSLDAASASIGNTLDTETLWKNPRITKELIKAVADAGFKSIRIPVTYYNHIDSKGNIDTKWFDRVEEVVNYALDAGLIVIINVHHDTGMNAKYRYIYADKTTYESDVYKLTTLWKQIAIRFRDYDERLVFEAANEIMDKDGVYLSPDNSPVVHKLNQAFITTVRATGGNNVTRFLGLATYVAGTQAEQTIGALDGGFDDVTADRLILAFHCYKDNEKDILRVVNRVYTNAQKYGIPVYIGEFGAESDVDESVRLEIARAFNKLSREYGIPAMWWDNGTGYSLFDRNTGAILYPELVSALTLK